MPDVERVVVEADGGSRGNPGSAGYGAVLKDARTGDVIAEAAEAIGHATNNVAEYRGLVAGLELYAEHAPGALLEVRMDSKLVIEQMAGRWKIKHPDLRPLAAVAQRLAPAGTVWTWVPRERNGHADRLANLAMDAAARGTRFEPSGAAAGPDPDRPAESPSLVHPLLGWRGLEGTPTKIVLLRHGETQSTADRLFSGPGGADPALIDTGREQARSAAQRLLATGGVDALISSPLRRTTETAEEASVALGLPVEIEDGFRECAFGEWDGHSLDEVEAEWPDELAAWMRSTTVRPPGGESIADVRRRVEEALQTTIETHRGQTVVVVSHVTPIKVCLRFCLDSPWEITHRMLVAPGSLTTMWFYESGASVLRQFSVTS